MEIIQYQNHEFKTYWSSLDITKEHYLNIHVLTTNFGSNLPLFFKKSRLYRKLTKILYPDKRNLKTKL